MNDLLSKYGVIIVVPNHIIDWWNNYYYFNQEKHITLMDLISKYGGVPDCRVIKYKIKEDFNRDCKLVRFSSDKPREGLEEYSSFCYYICRNLDVNKLFDDIQNNKLRKFG